MELFWKCSAGIVLSAILGLTISQKNFSVVLYMVICCMTAGIVLKFLSPVLKLLTQLEETGGLQKEMLVILMKILGIGILTPIMGSICADCGSSSLGKSLQVLGSVTILYLSLPMLSALLDILQEILREI